MPSLYSAIGIMGGAAIVGALVLNDAGQTQGQANGRVVALKGESNGTTLIDQPGADVVLKSQPGTQPTGVVQGGGDQSASGDDMSMMMTGDSMSMSGDMGMGMGMGMDSGYGMMGMASGAEAGMMAPAMGATTMGGAAMEAGGPSGWAFKPTTPVPTSRIAQEVRVKLDSITAPALSASLAELPAAIHGSSQIPVTMDQRGLQFAKQNGETQVKLNGDLPLRTALHQALQPLGLKAIVADEGLVITADPAALVHQGVGVNRWINVDEDAERMIAEKLDASVDIQMENVPLAAVVEYLNNDVGLPTGLDRRAIEEIGLSPEEPVSLTSNGGSLRSALSQLLRSSEMTYTIRDDMLVITTLESAEQDLITRIYWLEGTGTAAADYQTLIATLQSSIVPDGWNAMGGPFTMSRLNSTRPALVIGATYTAHHQLERFFEAMRETHFGGEPVLQQIQVPLSTVPAGAHDGGGSGLGGGQGGMF